MKIKQKNKYFSIVIPCETDRVEFLKDLIDIYTKHNNIEIVVPTRTIFPDNLPDVNVIKYEYKSFGSFPEFFCVSQAWNIGVKNSKYDNIIITGPETIPTTDAIDQLSALKRGNYVCQVFRQKKKKNNTWFNKSIVNSGFRAGKPSMHFLACFKKEDILAVNGWDETFSHGYAHEDEDFGERFVRAGLEFEVRDEIQAIHRWHPVPEGLRVKEAKMINRFYFEENIRNKVTFCKKGIIQDG